MERIIIVALILLCSCNSQKVITESKTVRDSVVIREVEKEVMIPAFEARSHSINIDSLQKLLKSGVSRELIQKTLIKEDPETKARVGILIDELGNLTAYCAKQEEIIKVLLQERDNYRFEFERVVVEQRDNIFKQVWKYVRNTLIIIGLLIIGLIAYRFFK